MSKKMRFASKFRLGLFGVTLFGLGLFGLSGVAGVTASASDHPVFHQELIIGTGWDATRTGDYQPLGMWEPGSLIYETLVNLDEGSQPLPCLAESWTVTGEGTVYTFHLRPKV